MAAKITVYISSPPGAATFAQRLRQAIVDHGGAVVSSPLSATPATPTAPTSETTEPAALGDREQSELQGAQAFVAVITPTAIQSPSMQAAAQRFYSAPSDRTNKRLIVPVMLEQVPQDNLPEALQGVPPVTGAYGTPELQDQLITETLRRLGLLSTRNPLLLLIAALLALLLLACCGATVAAPGGALHHFVAGNPTSQPHTAGSATRTPAPAPTATPAGTGLLGQYYSSTAYPCCEQVPDNVYGQELYSEVDPQINIRVNGDEPPDPRLANGAFAIRWTGTVRAQYSETYTFVTHSDDGVRLWVNGQLLIDDWTTHAEKVDQGTIALTAGQLYSIRLDYYENGEGHGAIITLQWQSASQPLELVPQSALYPAQGS